MPIQLTNPEKITNDGVVARIVALTIDREAERLFITINFYDSNGDVVRSFQYETPLRDGFNQLRITPQALATLRADLYEIAQEDGKIPPGVLA